MRAFYVVIVLGVYGGYALVAVELFERGNVALGAVVASILSIPAVALVALLALSFLAFAGRRAAARSVDVHPAE